MIVIFGSRLFGQVDKAPGLGSISTEFLHIQYFPLIPLKSFFISESSEIATEKIPLSWKSVLVAWSRACLIMGFAMAAIFAALEFSDGSKSNGITAIVFCVAFLCVFDLLRSTRGIGRASRTKEEQFRARLLFGETTNGSRSRSLAA